MAKSTTKAFVVPIKGHETDVAKLRELIKQAGCIPVGADAPVADYKKWLTDADVLVILAVPKAEGDPNVRDMVAEATRLGKRIVGVWSPGTKTSDLPAVINKHAEAVIVAEVESIREAICGGKAIWETHDGKPRPKPKTPRHKG